MWGSTCARALVVLAFINSWSVTAQSAKPTCGDGQQKGGEQCDGADLNGATCDSLGYAGGTLSCTGSCTFDTSLCGPPAGGSTCGDGVVEGFEECDDWSDAACPGLCSAHCACPGAAPGNLEVHVIDVGQGDAILVVSPDGYTMLLDAGEATEWGTVDAYLSAQGITDLDYTAVSHMHADHIGAMDSVINAHPEVVASFDTGSSYASTQYNQYDAAAGDRRTTLSVGQSIDMGPAMAVDVLHADAGSGNENNNSLVLRLTYGAQTILLGGDCESTCENSFDPGPIQIYKVHHHGASDASTEGLLDQMNPSTAIIPVGNGNAFGHPTQQTLDRLNARNIDIFRTDVDGDVVVVSDGVSYNVNGLSSCSNGESQACGHSEVGACSLGTQSCSGGSWGPCMGAVYPVSEDCGNGTDDDCDGTTDAADPDCGAAAPDIVIAQVGYDTPGEDALEEFVDLFNTTGSDLQLDGWSLADNTASWAIPNGTVVPSGGYISIARDAGSFQSLYGVTADLSGLTLSLANSGDQVVLSDSSGEVDRVAWEGYEPGWSIAAGIGDSIERTDPMVDNDTDADWSVTSPASPRGGAIGPPDDCGNGVCDPGEDCLSCAADCDGVTGGKPANRWCCGNGSCEAVGEDAGTCPVDCS